MLVGQPSGEPSPVPVRVLGSTLDVIAEVAEEGGEPLVVPGLLDRLLEPLILGLELAKRLHIRGPEVEAGDLVVGVDREHEAGGVRPGLDLQLHVRVVGVAEPQGVDRRLLPGHLAGALERRLGQHLLGRHAFRPGQPAADDFGDLARGIGQVQVDIDRAAQQVEPQTTQLVRPRPRRWLHERILRDHSLS